MNISYDARVDAVYIKLIPGHHEVDTKLVDDWVALDFDVRNRLVGIEVLDASERLELSGLLPVGFPGDFASVLAADGDGTTEPTSEWDRLGAELRRRKKAGVPVETLRQHRKNWVEEVQKDYVILKRHVSGSTVTVARSELEHDTEDQLLTNFKLSIARALRELASSL